MFGSWKLSEIPPPHVCASSEAMYVRRHIFLVHHHPFVEAVCKNPNITMSEAKPLWPEEFILHHDFCQSSTYTRAKNAILAAHGNDRVQNYNNLAAFLLQLQSSNPSMTIALQLDSQKRFYRLSIGFSQSTEYHGLITYSFMQTDGFHFKGGRYDGVCIVYCTKTGFGRNMILAFSIVPRETAEHHCWSLQMLWGCSPATAMNQIMFTDRGHLLSAVRNIHNKLGITVAINYCDRHFIRNIVAQFKIKKQFRHLISNGVRKCASSQTTDQFLAGIEEFATSLLSSLDRSTSALLTSRILIYILKVHPRFWTVFANRKCFDENSWNFQLSNLLTTLFSVLELSSLSLSDHEDYFKGDEAIVSNLDQEVEYKVKKHFDDMTSQGPPIPPPLPRFNVYTTNLVEGEALRAINNSTRMADVTNAILCFCTSMNKTISSLNKDCNLILEQRSKIRNTPIGYKIAVEQYSSANMQLGDVSRTSTPNEVRGSFTSDDGRSHSVVLTYNKQTKRVTHVCERCSLSEMMERPCKCSIATLKQAMRQNIYPK